MKTIKWVFFVIGAVLLAGVIGLGIYDAWEIAKIYNVAISNQSTAAWKNPLRWVVIDLIGAVVCGVFLGLALAWPRQRPLGAKDVDRLVAERRAETA